MYNIIKLLIDFILCSWIKRRSRFVQYDNRSIFIKSASQCNLLTFSA